MSPKLSSPPENLTQSQQLSGLKDSNLVQGLRPAQEAPDGAANIDNLLSMLAPQAPSQVFRVEKERYEV